VPDPGLDQASGLRRLFAGHRLRVISFVAAGEGVGKTHVVANLAVALARRGRSVLVLDENAGQDNVAGLFGVDDGRDLLDVINGKAELNQILVGIEHNLHICPAARALRQVGGFGPEQERFLVAALDALPEPPDTVLIDAAHDHPLGFSPISLVAPETVVVLSGRSHAITGAYALIKQVAQAYGRRNFGVLVNKSRDEREAVQIFDNLSRVARERGIAELDLVGVLPHDDAIAHAAWLHRPVTSAFPDAVSAEAFRALATALEHGGDEHAPAGIGHFLQQLVHWSQQVRPNTLHAR
jgi:flagellar biosynthesis protein FlhG